MRTIFYLLFITLLSCNSTDKCDSKELGNSIILENWKITDFHISKAELETTSKSNKVLVAKKIIDHHLKENSQSDKVIVFFDKILDSREAYILILNDSIKYQISSFELFEETKMTGVSEINLCTVKSFLVNNKRISYYPAYNQIIFNKNLD